jgi:predicted dehydrogenase
MNETPRWGIIGTGGIARAFVRDLLLDGHAVTAVGSRAEATADAFAREFGLQTAHPSYQALAEDPDVDIVYVATPHTFHYANASLALRSGKHVLVEKPFTINAAQAVDLIELARAHSLVILEAMWTRWLPHMVRIREIIADGALGLVRAMNADHSQLLPADPTHRLNAPELGGGALLDLGVYPVSFASQLFGPEETAQAAATLTPTGVDGHVAAILSYPSGAMATFQCASTMRGPVTATVTGAAGRIEIDAVWYAPASFRVYDSANQLVESYQTPEITGRGMQFQAREMEDLVRRGQLTSDVLPADETISVMGTLDRIRQIIGVRYPGE